MEIVLFIIIFIADFGIGYIFISLFEKFDLWYAENIIKSDVPHRKKYEKQFKLKIALLWAILGVLLQQLYKYFS